MLSNAGTTERPDIRTCKLPDLKRKLASRHNTAQDMNMNPVSANDIVNIQEGSLKGKQCTVHHVHRGFLFGRCREVMEFGGIVCVRARGCSVHGGKASEAVPQHRVRPAKFSSVRRVLLSFGAGGLLASSFNLVR